MTSPSSTTAVQVGQDSPFVAAIEQGLIATGTSVAVASLAASEPWTKLPIISWLVSAGIKFAITKTVDETDDIVYKIYVAAKDAVQVSQYMAAQASGNQGSIDQSANSLIGLGNE